MVYFIYIFFTFDILGISERAKLDNAVTLVSDSFSHKTHVVLDNRRQTYAIAIEGEKKGTYPKGMKPAWVRFEGKDARVDLEDGYNVAFTGTTVRFVVPDYGVIEATPTRRQIDITLPTDKPVPTWISASRTRLSVTTPNGRVAVTKARTVIYRYQMGWELFLFTLDSPFYGKSLGALMSLAFSGERVVPARSNLAAMASDIWYNKMWRHGEVAWAIFETILIAFLGTVGGAIVALPLAFFVGAQFHADG
jgi:phosphonate transport system permease protein